MNNIIVNTVGTKKKPRNFVPKSRLSKDSMTNKFILSHVMMNDASVCRTKLLHVSLSIFRAQNAQNKAVRSNIIIDGVHLIALLKTGAI
jgi:hypothetical protein